MKKIKKSTGITLIVLIITVIVMIILVGVTVNVALNGGLFDTAKQAASGMEMAQIRERAETVKANLFAEAQYNDNVKLDEEELKNRLLEEFDGSTAEGNKVIVEDGKYDIIIKNSDLDIEVVEHSDNINIEADKLLDLSYNSINIDSEGKTYGVNVKLNIKALMTLEEYEIKKSSIPYEEKKKEILEYLSTITSKQISSIDDYIVYMLNSNEFGITHNNIDDWLVDPILLEAFNKEKITKEQLYANFLGNGEKDSITEEEAIETFYKNIFYGNFLAEYYTNTQNLSIYLMKDGKEELLYDNVYASTDSTTEEYLIAENGTYQFEIRTGEGNTVTSNALEINNIEQNNPYVLTEEEADGIWTTDENGNLKKYLGQEETVFIPIKIGNEAINKIGQQCFADNKTLKTVKMLGNITSIGKTAFVYNSNLQYINIPDGVKTIEASAFYGLR